MISYDEVTLNGTRYRVRLESRNAYTPDPALRGGHGWIVTVLDDPAKVAMPAINRSCALDAARARAEELEQAKAIEAEVRGAR